MRERESVWERECVGEREIVREDSVRARGERECACERRERKEWE